MFDKEIEKLNKAIKHLETDILPSKCNGNISCYNEHIQLYEWLKELKSYKESVETQNDFIIQLQKELKEEKKLNAEIKARFVKCNTCTDEMKSKCLMFTENLCEGERCEELIDIVSLVNKSDLERKIEELEKNIKLKNKQLRAGFEAQIENIDLKEQIKAMKKYLDCDLCEYQNNKDECHQCNYFEKTRWTFKKEDIRK